MGAFQGVLYPGIMELLSHWVLPDEKSFMIALSLSGSQLGIISVFAASPLMITHFGWETPFYFFSFLGLIWSILWYCLIHDTPESHPGISAAELNLIREKQHRTQQLEETLRTRRREITYVNLPWKRLFLTRPIFALGCLTFCYAWTFSLMVSVLPKYLTFILDYQGAEQGLFAMLPYVGLWMSTTFSGYLADALIRSGLRVTFVRKFMVLISLTPTVPLLFLFEFLPSYRWAFPCLVTLITLSGLSKGGFSPNPLDLSNEYAGIITSVVDLLAGIAGLLAPYVAGQILYSGSCRSLPGEQTTCVHAWHSLFKLSGALYLFGVLMWGLFASGDPLDLGQDEKENIKPHPSKTPEI